MLKFYQIMGPEFPTKKKRSWNLYLPIFAFGSCDPKQ
jgi:hypothetical protein